jgi:endonuclease YncB( thermonuclease family)
MGGRDVACGRETARRLAAFIGDTNVTCSGRRRDRFDRVLAHCVRGEDDINAWLVDQGLARADRADIALAARERRARRDRRGWWAGQWDDPAIHRDARR